MLWTAPCFKDQFDVYKIDIHDPRYGSWVDASHQSWSGRYQADWQWFFDTVKDINVEKILAYARELSVKYGFEVHF